MGAVSGSGGVTGRDVGELGMDMKVGMVGGRWGSESSTHAWQSPGPEIIIGATRTTVTTAAIVIKE